MRDVGRLVYFNLDERASPEINAVIWSPMNDQGYDARQDQDERYRHGDIAVTDKGDVGVMFEYLHAISFLNT